MQVLVSLFALDIIPAPKDAGDGSVLLWAVVIVVTWLIIVVSAMWKLMNKNQAECREENKRAWARCDEQQEKIETLYAGALTETKALARTAIDEAAKNREVLERNTKVIAGLESGKHRVRDQ